MSFDEQLRRAFDTLSDQLRGELNRQFAAMADELNAANRAARDGAAAEARDTAEAAAAARVAEVERQRSEAEAESRAAADRARELEEQVKASAARADTLEREAQESARRVRDLEERADADAARVRDATANDGVAAGERLVDAVRALDRARSLSEILDTLVGCAGREAPRVSVLLVRGGQLRGWRFLGFGDALDAARDLDIPAADAGIVGDAARTAQMVSTDSHARPAPTFARLANGEVALAVPLSLAGQVVAVVYADQRDVSGVKASPQWRSSIEVLARHAAATLEALTAFKAARSMMAPAGTSSERGSGDAPLLGS